MNAIPTAMAAWQEGAPNYGDAAAWALLVFLFVTLLAIACCVMALRIRPPGPQPHHELIEEVQRDEDKLACSTPGREEGASPWEKPADWWKGEKNHDSSP